MNRKVRRSMSIGLAVMLVLFGLALPTPTQAQAVNASVPFAATVFVPCADGGAGEFVDLSGPLHVQFQLVTNNSNSGGGHFSFHANAQGISGVGLTSGNQYRGTGVFKFKLALSGPVEHVSIDGHFQAIGQGPGNNLRVHFTLHFNLNTSNGHTVTVTNGNITCN